jgi:hypothetical protein
MIQSKEMGRGQNTRKNIQWKVEEWKRHIVVIRTTVTKMIITVMMSTVFPLPSKRKNKHIFSSTHPCSSYLPPLFSSYPSV